MNVLIGHDLIPIEIPYFGPDRISVEFFFVLSGYLFFHSLEKYKDMPLGRAALEMTVSKIKPLFIPMVIGVISNIILNHIANFPPYKIFRYLWYIPAMLIAFLLYTVLRVLIKNEKTFWATTIGICLFATLLRFSGPEVLFFFDYGRSIASVSLGLLLAKASSKYSAKHKWLCWILLIPVLVATFATVFYGLAENSRAYEALLDLVLFPLLIFITFKIDFNMPVFNYLGALSFGIYAYQCPARLIEYIGIGDRWTPFCIIIVLAVTDDLIRRVYRYIKQKKQAKIKEVTQ